MLTRAALGLCAASFFVAGGLLAAARGCADAARQAGDLSFEPHTLQVGDQRVPAELGRLTVPESRKSGSGRLLDLAFLRLKSTTETPGAPIVYLEGGPGSSPIQGASEAGYFTAFQKLRELGDVILLDQRGVGRSRPALLTLTAEPLPPDTFVRREVALQAIAERARKAAAHWRGQGVDLSAYNTEESADDVDDLRRALGVEKVRLVGFSYGTHLGLSVLRRHGTHVERAALLGTEGPDHTRKLPSTYDRQVAKLAALVAADDEIGTKVPDFTGLLKRVFEKLEREPLTVPVTHPLTKKMETVRLGKFGLQLILLLDFSDTSDIPGFPALLTSLERGDVSRIAPLVQRRYAQLGLATPVLMLAMDAASGASPERWARIRREEPGSLMGDVVNFPFPEAGEALGIAPLGPEFRKPVRTDVPTLFVSGTLDANAPVEQAEEVRAGFSRSVHVIAENAGHEDLLVRPWVQRAIQQHFRGEAVDPVRWRVPPPNFWPLPPDAK